MAIWTTPRRSTIPTPTPARDDHVTDPGEPPRRTTSVSCPDAPTSHGPGITGSWNSPKPGHSDGPAPPGTPTPSNPTPSPSQRSSTRRQPTTPRRSDQRAHPTTPRPRRLTNQGGDHRNHRDRQNRRHQNRVACQRDLAVVLHRIDEHVCRSRQRPESGDRNQFSATDTEHEAGDHVGNHGMDEKLECRG